MVPQLKITPRKFLLAVSWKTWAAGKGEGAQLSPSYALQPSLGVSHDVLGIHFDPLATWPGTSCCGFKLNREKQTEGTSNFPCRHPFGCSFLKRNSRNIEIRHQAATPPPTPAKERRWAPPPPPAKKHEKTHGFFWEFQAKRLHIKALKWQQLCRSRS